MIIAIIAGGSGTRLWPLSTPDKPKHLLKLTNDKSMLQNTHERAAALTQDIYIISEASHSAAAKAQLPQVPSQRFIIEPARRGTASAILLALNTISQQHPADEVVAFLHADHHITDIDSFGLAVKTAAQAAQAESKIALIGVEPYYPSTGFGYIEKGPTIQNGYKLPVYRVAKFKEKPDHEAAQQYLATGNYLWNMGLFAAPIKVFEAEVKTHAPSLYRHYQKLQKAKSIQRAYLEFPNEAIDTALIEKSPNVLVVPGTFSWADIGSFHDLHNVSERNQDGNVHVGEGKIVETRNSYVRNETVQPALVIGLDNVVVINTPDGLLVCHRDYAQKVGDTIKLYWRENSDQP